MKKFILKFFRPIIIFILEMYWFIFRPKTFWAKIILTHNGEVLLVKTTYGYKLTLPGGGLHKNEKPEAAAKRELKEELGLEIENLTYIGSHISTVEYKIDTIYVYYAELPHKEVTIDHIEISDAVWQPLDSITQAGPVTLKLIEMYKNK